MNDCIRCNSPIPDGVLGNVCRNCIERASFQTYLAYQKQVLKEICAGKGELRLAHLVEQPWHIVLLGDPEHAYCGQKIGSGWKHKHENILSLTRLTMCKLCMETLDRLCVECGALRPQEVSGAAST